MASLPVTDFISSTTNQPKELLAFNLSDAGVHITDKTAFSNMVSTLLYNGVAFNLSGNARAMVATQVGNITLNVTISDQIVVLDGMSFHLSRAMILIIF